MFIFVQKVFMLTTIKGVYDNGVIILNEQPSVSGQVEVLVTFTENTANVEHKQKRQFGFGKGSVLFMSEDFNAPLDDLKDYM